MPCCKLSLKNGMSGIICGDLGPHCVDCGGVGDFLCDYPVGKDKTCDRSICAKHSHVIGVNLHYCETHHKMWEDFRSSGGVKKILENVIPFNPANKF